MTHCHEITPGLGGELEEHRDVPLLVDVVEEHVPGGPPPGVAPTTCWMAICVGGSLHSNMSAGTPSGHPLSRGTRRSCVSEMVERTWPVSPLTRRWLGAFALVQTDTFRESPYLAPKLRKFYYGVAWDRSRK